MVLIVILKALYTRKVRVIIVFFLAIRGSVYIAQWTFCDNKMKIMEKHVKEIRLRNIYIIRVPTNMSDFDL